MDRANFRSPAPPADLFNAPRWTPKTVASRGGGTVACGRVLDATVRSSCDTVANGERSNALPRQKVHGLSQQVCRKPDARTQAFRTAAKGAPTNTRAEKYGEERSDSPNRAENGGQGPHPPLFARCICVYFCDSDQLDLRVFSSIWDARCCCGAVLNPKSLN